MIILLYCIIEKVTVDFDENIGLFTENTQISTRCFEDIHIIALKFIFDRIIF